MKISSNRTGYYIKEGITSIFTHGLMSFASVCIIIAFLVIVGSFILIALNINAMVGDLADDNVILVYVHEDLSDVDALALSVSLGAIPNVTDVEFISREKALNSFIGRFENTERYKDVDPSWLRHRYAVHVEDVALLAETRSALKDVYGVAKVNANLEIAKMLVSLRRVVSVASLVIIAVLLAIALFIMANTIRVATFERREEIAIMRIVGGTNSFIRWPFIYEGFILGLTGSMSAFVILWTLYEQVVSRVLLLEVGFVRMIPFSGISLPLFVAFAAIGFGVGVGGSAVTLNRYLKV